MAKLSNKSETILGQAGSEEIWTSTFGLVVELKPSRGQTLVSK